MPTSDERDDRHESASLQTTAKRFVRNLLALQYREVVMTVGLLGVVAPAVLLSPIAADSANPPTTFRLCLLGLAAVVGGVSKGVTGIGYSLIVTSLAVEVVDPTLAVVALAVPLWMLNVFQVGETGTGLEYVRTHRSLVVLAVVGSGVGVAFLDAYRTGPVIPLVIGLVVLGYVGFRIVHRSVVVDRASNPAALGVVGALQGFLYGATNIGPLLPTYLHAFERDAERYVGGISMVFTFMLTERIVHMLLNGLMTPYRLWLGGVLGLPTLVGLAVGTYLRRTGARERFDRVLLALLAVIGVNLLVSSVSGLLAGG